MAHKRPKPTQLALQGGIPGTVTGVSLELRESLSFAKWQECGALIGKITRACQFWLSDWLVFGEDHYGEKFAQALDATGHDEKTLLNWVRVGRAVAISRRRESLSFSHHEAVSTLDPDDQRYWLSKAEKGDKLPSGEWEPWSSRRLRQEIKKVVEDVPPADPEIEVVSLADLVAAIVKDEVPLEFVTVDVKAIREAYAKGTTEVPGVKITPPAEVKRAEA